MSQLVQPVEVTWKRAIAIWWNFTWRQIAVFVTIAALNTPLDVWISSMDDGTFKNIMTLGVAAESFLLFFSVKFRDYSRHS